MSAGLGEDTAERWVWDFVTTTVLAEKLEPRPLPGKLSEGLAPLRISAPGRPPELICVARAPKAPRPGALATPKRRAELFHTFLHHELQAAELFAWAVLAFADAELAFRAGLLRLVRDELRHMRLYREHMRVLGFDYGDFPVRDWFWERVPKCPSPASFLAVMGLGLEAANLDHAARFTAALRAAGDERAAEIEAQVGREEVPHVRFAVTWITRFEGRCDYATWRALLPPPLSPLVFRGEPMQREARCAAGMPEAMLDAIRDYRGT
jgi:uncharacterized ferritin-like protein (DUF455 family)